MKISKSATLLVLSAFLLTLVMTASAWTDAPPNPPNGNLPAPLHVGTTEQMKEGALGLKGLSVTGVASITKNSFSFPVGNASLLLAVNGDIAAKRYCDVTGQNCVTSLGGSGTDTDTDTDTKGENAPDFESGWINAKAWDTGIIDHNLGTDRFETFQTIVRQNGGANNDEAVFEGYAACENTVVYNNSNIWGIYFNSDKDISANSVRYWVGYSGPCYHAAMVKANNRNGNWTTHVPSKAEFKIRIWK